MHACRLLTAFVEVHAGSMAELAIIHYSNTTAGDSYLGKLLKPCYIARYFRFYSNNYYYPPEYVHRSRVQYVLIQCTESLYS